jgi:hypothetical protein
MVRLVSASDPGAPPPTQHMPISTLIATAHSLAAFTNQIALIAGVYGILTSLSPMLQIVQMRRAGSSESLSRSYIAISVGGYLVWFAYGVAMWNMPLIVSDAIGAAMQAAVLYWAFRLHPATARRAQPATA